MNGRVTISVLSAAMLLLIMIGTACMDGGVSVEIARSGFEAESDLWRENPSANIDSEMVHEGVGSLFVFATGLVKVPIMDVPNVSVVGDSLTVTLWARTQILQESTVLEMLIDREGLDPRLAQVRMNDVRRTTPWSPVQIAFHLVPDEHPTRLRLALIVPQPGKLWIDDVVIWDGAPRTDAGTE